MEQNKVIIRKKNTREGEDCQQLDADDA